MIELYRDSSGEVDLSSGPGSEGKSAAVFANLTTQDDAKKIAELRNTIKSLQMQIEVCNLLQVAIMRWIGCERPCGLMDKASDFGSED